MTWRKHLILFLILIGLATLNKGLFGQEQSNALQSIQLIPLENYERLELIFENNYTQAPIIDFDTGFIYLRLAATTIGTPARQFVFPESSQLVKTVRATQNQNSTLVEIILNSANLSLENKVKFTLNGQRLWVDLDRRVVTQAAQPLVERDISQEVAQRLRQGDPLSASEPEAATVHFIEEEPAIIPQFEDNWMMTLITLILALLLIFLLLFVLLFFYKKMVSWRLPALEGKFKMRTVSTFHIGPKQKIVVLEVGRQYFACGITSNNITFLTEVRNEQDQSFLQNVRMVDDEIDFNADQARADFLKTLETARKQSQQMQKPVQVPEPQQKTTFEEALQQETINDTQTETTTQAPESQKPPVASQKIQSPQSETAKEPDKSFDTPVLTELETTPLESNFENDASLQQFAKKLSQRLKLLKPIE